MSNAADPVGPPRRRLGWDLAAALAVPAVLLAVLVAFVVASPTTLGLSPRNARPGGTGIGDPYYPDHGNAGYDVRSYAVSGEWSPDLRQLQAEATIVAAATTDLRQFHVDLYLDVAAVMVNGEPAEFEREDRLNVTITPQRRIREGEEFTVVVGYGGDPAASGRGERAWYDAGGEWTAAGEPGSAPWWFPANDHPSDPATFQLSLRVPRGTEVISVGRLISRDADSDADFDTWQWQLSQPAATYLIFMSIGQFVVEDGTVGGRQAVYAVSEKYTPAERESILAKLRTTPEVIRRLEADYGPYPFTEIGGIAPSAEFWFAGLETQTRPIYLGRALLDPFANELITHELAHQWFGDHVTLREWNDIFINEAYASFAWWRDAEVQELRSAQESFDRTFEQTKDNPGFWRITMTDPGVEELFGPVYVRGPMALQALRNVMGDESFFTASREWAQQPGVRSLEDWRTHMQSHTDTDLTGFYAAWLDGTAVPAQTPENGFG